MKKQTKEDIKWFFLIVGAGIVAEVIAEAALRHVPLATVLPEVLPEVFLKADTQSNGQILMV
jgi:hypothetical protein